MDRFIAQYGTASFESLIEATEGALVEQMRKQAYLKQQQEDMLKDEEAMWEAWAAEDQDIHEQLMTGGSSGSQDAPLMTGGSNGSQDDPAAEAKAKALQAYRDIEALLRDAAMNGEGVDEQARLAYWAAENKVATEQSIKWRDRGPRGVGAPKVFKGNQWREGSQRYSTRAGTRKAEFAAKYSGQKSKKESGKNSTGGKKGSQEDASNREGGKKGSKTAPAPKAMPPASASNREGGTKGSKDDASNREGGKKGSKEDASNRKGCKKGSKLMSCENWSEI